MEGAHLWEGGQSPQRGLIYAPSTTHYHAHGGMSPQDSTKHATAITALLGLALHLTSPLRL